ncbi:MULTISPECIES: hypothetical protein [Streptomyces]|uniref:Uncharacterized protein n=1 Tax=Streptomyces solicathayae TaxID=3081768 RepID=A0ABZ0LPK8_9ACTN|nr:hypothetical protein [Streptomyces sp. HUAS YS2]WOX21156.1 hypothetical protein R2D22_07060 [Streptomyces sp. HUAS YS2]
MRSRTNVVVPRVTARAPFRYDVILASPAGRRRLRARLRNPVTHP